MLIRINKLQKFYCTKEFILLQKMNFIALIQNKSVTSGKDFYLLYCTVGPSPIALATKCNRYMPVNGNYGQSVMKSVYCTLYKLLNKLYLRATFKTTLS